MSRKIRLFFIVSIVLTLVLAACGTVATEAPPDATEVPTEVPPTPTEEPAPTEEAPAEEAAPAEEVDAALRVTGNVASEQAWTEEEVKAMETTKAQSTNNSGETQTYTGVLLADLLTFAQPNADATTVVFVTGDGIMAEIDLAELMACTNCIASFRNKGGFSTVLPDYPGSLQVKGVVEIQVK